MFWSSVAGAGDLETGVSVEGRVNDVLAILRCGDPVCV